MFFLSENSELLLWSLAAGGMFSLNAVAYRLGQDRGIPPVHIAGLTSLIAIVLLGGSGVISGELFRPSGSFLFWGLAAGFSQYLMNLLVRPALNYISLSAVWCALMLYFIPVSLFSWLMLRENFQLGCLIGIPAAVGAVYFASRRLTREGENKLCLKTGPFLLLCALAVCNGLAPLVMKLCSRYAVLPDGEDPLVKYRIAFLFWFYAGIALPSFWDFARFSASEQRWSRLYLCAAVMTIGSLGGMGIQCRLMQAPAALVFPTINVTSVLLVGIVSLLFFREKMTVSRLVTIGLALLTILTFSICG